jgi:uncharacterized RDD family membrane protein YckC
MENQEFKISADLLATKTQRFLNFVLDMAIIYVLVLATLSTINIIAEMSGNDDLRNWVDNLSCEIQLLIGILILLFYYSLTEIYFSRSLAKYFTKTIVVRADGSKPNLKSIIIRTLSRLIPFDPFSYLTSNPQGLHDQLSVTNVVKKGEFQKKRGL